MHRIDVQEIVAIAKEAGRCIMQIYKHDFEVEYKQDKSPLTLADRMSNDIIERALGRLSINYPILSEESKHAPYDLRRNWKYYWLVDPLDGTKEFVKKNNEFTVNIALIFQNTPILGVVYAPALDLCYWAKQGEGAFKNGIRLPYCLEQNKNTFKIVISRSHVSDETQAFVHALNTKKKKKELVSIGSSLKLCLVAEGRADIYPRLGPTMEWDTGAAHAILKESMCEIYCYDDNSVLKYNSKESLLNPYFYCKRKEKLC